jgi:RNA polymerase sigma-70 factor (ECF subfamily)
VHASFIERLAADVDGAFEELVRSEQGYVFGVALRLTLDRHEAEEVAQEAFVRAYRALAGYESQRIRFLHLRPWLAQIVLNVQRNRVRRHRPVSPLDELRVPAAAPAADGPEATAEATARRELCAHALATLPEPYRLAVGLRHIEGLSYPEVAEALGRPVGTVKAQVHRGLRLLRSALEDDEISEWKEWA